MEQNLKKILRKHSFNILVNVQSGKDCEISFFISKSGKIRKSDHKKVRESRGK